MQTNFRSATNLPRDTKCISLFTLPLWVHIVAFIQLVFNHLVTTNLQRRTSDVHPCQGHSERTNTDNSLSNSSTALQAFFNVVHE